MVAADMRFWCSPDPPPSPTPKNVAGVLRVGRSSWSMMGALSGPLLTGGKTTKLDWSCAHTGAPASASFSP